MNPFGYPPALFRPTLMVGEGAVSLHPSRIRLLAAHSEARRVPLCSVDRRIRAEHRFLVEELRG